MAEMVQVRNACPANITYDLPEYGLEEVKPGDVIDVPKADIDRFPESVWAREGATKKKEAAK